MRDRASEGAPEIGRVERIVAMRKFPGAAALHANELTILASVARPRRLGPGELLSTEGASLHAITLVLEGELAVRSHEVVLERAGPGRAVGVLSALAHGASGLECRAERGALVLTVSLEDLEDVFEEVPGFLVGLMDWVGHRTHALAILPRESATRPRSAPPEPRSAPMDLVERVLRLRACSTFANVSIDAVTALADVAREVHARAGEMLWHHGDDASTLFALVDGELDVTLDGKSSTTLGAGDLAGGPAVFAGRVHTTEARARTELVALAIDREALLDAWEDHIDLGVELLRDACATVLAAGAPTERGPS